MSFPENTSFGRFYHERINPDAATVTLAYCHGDYVRPAFMRSVVTLLATDRGRHLHGYVTSEGLYVPRGRNEIVAQFLNSQCDWLWFLDTDVAFPPDTLSKLVEATADGERKIVAAPYWSVGDDGESYCTWMGVSGGRLLPYYEIPSVKTVELAACGMGCTLIHRDVFVDIARDRGNDDPWVWFGHDLADLADGPTRLGEDVSFSVRAREAGHTTWGVCDVPISHLKTQAVQRGKVGVSEESPQAA